MFRIDGFTRSMLFMVLLLLVSGVLSLPAAAGDDDVEFFEGFEGQALGQAPSGWVGRGVDFFGNYVPLIGPNDFFVDDTHFLTGGQSMKVEFAQPSPDIAVIRPLGETLSPPARLIWNERHDPVGTGSQGPSQGSQHIITLLTGADCGFSSADTCQAVAIIISPHPGDQQLAVFTTFNGQWGVRNPVATLPFTRGFEWTEFRIDWGTDNLVNVYIDGNLIMPNVPIDPGLTFDTIRWTSASCCHTGDFWFDDIQIIALDDDLDDDELDDDEPDDDEPDDDEPDDDEPDDDEPDD